MLGQPNRMKISIPSHTRGWERLVTRCLEAVVATTTPSDTTCVLARADSAQDTRNKIFVESCPGIFQN